MFNFGLKTVLLTLHNAWIVSLEGGWRGMLPTRRGAVHVPCFFKKDREK